MHHTSIKKKGWCQQKLIVLGACMFTLLTLGLPHFLQIRAHARRNARTHVIFIVVECFAGKRGNAAQEFWDRLLTGVLVEHHDI